MLNTRSSGNTHMLFGIYRGEELLGSFRISTNSERTSDELGLMLVQYYQLQGLDIGQTRAVIIASVVPPVMHTLNNALTKYICPNVLTVGVDIDTGVVNRYHNPEEVGIDRLVNAVSAMEKFGAPLIIVDIGTATTFDAIDADGAYLGGAIFPGIKAAMEALYLKTAKLPQIDILMPEHAIGKTTVESMQSGAVRGYVGALKGIVREIKAEMGYAHIPVIATGGMGRMMAEYCDEIDDVDSSLTLEGLRLIYERNQKSGA